MTKGQAKRRSQNAAIAAYLQHIANELMKRWPKWNQQQIAAQLGIHKAQFTQAKNGETTSPLVVRAFAKATGTNSDKFLEFAEDWYREHAIQVAATRVYRAIPEGSVSELIAKLKELAESESDRAKAPRKSAN